MALVDIFMLTFFQVYLPTGESILNNFFFRRAAATGTAADLIDAVNNATDLIGKWQDCQTNNMKGVLLKAINLGLLTDFREEAYAFAGGAVYGGDMPIHDAINFTLRVDTRAVRPGSKRLAGLGEDAVVNGVVTDAGYIAALEALRLELETPQVGALDTYLPIVVKRVLRPPDVDHEHERYTLPETDGELVIGNVTSALVNLRVSHQTSRGNGR